jgi:secreted trypsin-like serine protease
MRKELPTSNSIICALVVLASVLSSGSRAADTSAVADQSMARFTGNPDYDAVVQRFLNKEVKKIVGGMEVAKDGAYPWQASLGVVWIPDPAQAHYCGGAIYNSQWLLTAAHCLDGIKSSDVTIVVGTNHLRADTVRHNVELTLIHASFDRKSLRNDIGLVKLAEPLQFSELIDAIDLASAESESSYLTAATDDLIITGWGAEVERGPHAIDLRYAMETFIPKDICNMPLSYGNSIAENMLCAGFRGRGTCDADSGGPLFLLREHPILFGLTSYAKGCAEPLKFDVFTRITKYKDWVRVCVATPSAPHCHKN